MLKEKFNLEVNKDNWDVILLGLYLAKEDTIRNIRIHKSNIFKLSEEQLKYQKKNLKVAEELIEFIKSEKCL